MSKRSTNLQLAIMGATLPLVLGACSDNNPPPQQTQQVASTESPVYKSVDDCVNAGNDRALCQQALDNVSAQTPRFNSQDSCINQYGADRCVARTENGQSIWMPMLTGFMLGHMLSGGHTRYVYQPVYVPRPSYRPSSTWGSSYTPSTSRSYNTTTTTTTSRSVFGSSASARGSWGGSSSSGG